MLDVWKKEEKRVESFRSTEWESSFEWTEAGLYCSAPGERRPWEIGPTLEKGTQAQGSDWLKSPMCQAQTGSSIDREKELWVSPWQPGHVSDPRLERLPHLCKTQRELPLSSGGGEHNDCDWISHNVLGKGWLWVKFNLSWKKPQRHLVFLAHLFVD